MGRDRLRSKGGDLVVPNLECLTKTVEEKERLVSASDIMERIKVGCLKWRVAGSVLCGWTIAQ